VWLPVEASWNGRLYMVGGGGYAGTLSLGAMNAGLAQGYATATTDTGHEAAVFPLATFALNDRQSEMDYSYRAVNETVITAKELIEAHYGKKSKYNYWVGCSTGGRQGLMEAQRFPKDFDGLIVGAPVLEFTDTQIGGLWNAKSLTGAGAIPASKLPLLAAAELARCDVSDGLVDGQITDPRLCDFKPQVDLPACVNDVDGAACFTSAQREAVAKVYDGPRTSSGFRIFPGYAVGTAVLGPASGWIPWFVNPSGAPSLLEIFGATFMQNMAFTPDPGPSYDWRTQFDFDRDPFRMHSIRSILDADDANLKQFERRGGKIIQYHGWADAALTPYMSINYYERVLREMGRGDTKDFYKLYMVPAMFHCAGGPGPNTFDVFNPLVNWVEHGIEPDEIIARNATSGRTRPLCPYPQIATYRGGNPEVASSFACEVPH
jgi:feruloyl esterase